MRVNGLKLTGFIIALLALVYKVVSAVMNFEYLSGWWAKWIFMYFVLYGTSGAVMASAFTKRTASLVISIVMLVLSTFFFFMDGIIFLGIAASLGSGTLSEHGIMPLVNLANIAASVLILIGAVRSKEQEIF